MRNVIVELCRPIMRVKNHEEVSFNLASSQLSTVGSLVLSIIVSLLMWMKGSSTSC